MFPSGLVRRLADGAWHRVDDAALCCEKLAEVGLTAEADAGRCRLKHPLSLLDAEVIRAALPNPQNANVEVIDIGDSTNTRLLECPAPPVGRASVLLAEYQRSGRGRAGRQWLAPFGGGLCLSVAWRMAPPPERPGTLSLATGLAVRRALARLGLDDTRLKWPNDILHDGRKLGGVLIDAAPIDGALHVVAGIGINVRLAPADFAAILAAGGLEATDLARIDAALPARRNELAAALIASVSEALQAYQQKGFDPFREEWNHADGIFGYDVEVSGTPEPVSGRAAGIDDTGALLVRCGDVTHRVFSGDVRVRVS